MADSAFNVPDLFSEPEYVSPAVPVGPLSRLFPSLAFYARSMSIVFRAARKAKAGQYPGEEWAKSSCGIVHAAESVGGKLVVEGLEHFKGLSTPCLFVGNHMSTLETFILPCMIQPWKQVTFVIKESLQTYPVFGHVMRSRDPIVVGRANPRHDLKAVLEGGEERLKKGTSIVIFPQSTRMTEFDPEKFNTIGIKLAKRAQVPVIPVALKTDFWGNGSIIKDFGSITPKRTIHVRFAPPMMVAGNGQDEHAAICRFITESLNEWRDADTQAALQG